MPCVPHAPADTMRTEGTLPAATITALEVFDPAFAVEDADATVLARYEDGAVAGAMRAYEDYTTATFQLPPTDPAVLRELWRQAGVHVYSEGGEALLVGGGMVVVTKPKGGAISLTLKNGRKIADSFPCATTAVYDETTGERIG